MPDFLSLISSSTNEYESPTRFYYWSALAAVSAIMKDHTWFDMGKNYKLYPNIYVLLYGPSGVRKGPPISLAEKIVNLVGNTRVINGRASIEAIIKELGTIQTREGKPPLKDSCGFVAASELSSSLISNPSAMDIMTHLYDRIYNEGEWKYRLKVGESQRLNNPTITWLAGTNEALFRDFVPEKNIHGGLIGRMFMVSENRPSKLNSLMFDPSIVPNLGEMANILKDRTNLTGPFKMSDDLRHEVNKFYIDFMTNKAPQLQDETGFVSRILDFVIKVAMLISTGRRGDLELIESDIEESMEVVLPLIIPTKRVSQSLKKTDPSEITKRALIVGYIVNRPDYSCGRKEMLKNLGMQINHEDLDKVIGYLMQFDAVVSQHHGGETIYKLNMSNEKVAKWAQNYRR